MVTVPNCFGPGVGATDFSCNHIRGTRGQNHGRNEIAQHLIRRCQRWIPDDLASPAPAGTSNKKMRRALFWTMLPLMTPQALWVRRTAQRFAEAAGPAFGSVGAGVTRHLVAVGDSIIAGLGAPTLADALVGQTARALADRLAAEVDWQAFGRTGERSSGLVSERLATLPDIDADYVIVSMGVNDVTGLSTRSHFAQNMRRTLRGLRLKYPHARIAVAGLPPMDLFPVLPQPLRAFLGMRARMLSKTLQNVVAGQPGIVFVPIGIEFSPERFSEDGFHPSPLGYREYGEAMAEALAATPAPKI